jgi:hypothetical protein
MASLLASLGLTNTAAPDPSAYTNIQAEATNLTSAKTAMSDTISNIGIALNAADLLDINPSYTNTLKSLQSEATAVISSNMTSAQIAAKTADLSTKLQVAQKQQVEAVQKQAVEDLTTAMNTVSARVTVVTADKTMSAELLAQYKQLLTDANAAVEAAKKPSSGSAGSGDRTVYKKPDELLAILDDLDTKKDAEENKEFNWPRFFKKILRITMYCLLFVSVGFGLLLGGIATSNAYADDYFWAIKVFYFIYGAAAFPITLIMVAVKKPYWVSGLIPLKSLVPRTVPGVSASGPYADTTASAAAPAAAPGAPPTAQNLLSQFGSLISSKLKGGGEEDIATDTTSAPIAPIVLIADPAAALTLTDKLFGYILVDPKHPTPAQTSSQNILRILSIVELVLLSAVGIYYGVDKLILKNRL